MTSTAIKAITGLPTVIKVNIGPPIAIKVISGLSTAIKVNTGPPTAIKAIKGPPTAIKVIIGPPTVIKAITGCVHKEPVLLSLKQVEKKQCPPFQIYFSQHLPFNKYHLPFLYHSTLSNYHHSSKTKGIIWISISYRRKEIQERSLCLPHTNYLKKVKSHLGRVRVSKKETKSSS